MSSFIKIATRGMLLTGLVSIVGCDRSSDQATAPTDSAVPAGAARVVGVARDSAGQTISQAKIHVYENGNDTVSTHLDSTDGNGNFQVDVHPGKTRLFFEKDGRAAQYVDYSNLKDQQCVRLDSLRLRQVLDGSFTIPGITAASSFSVKVIGSPLEATFSTSGEIHIKVVYGQESILVVSFETGGTISVYRFRVRANGGVLSITPYTDTTAVVAAVPVPSSAATVEIHPGPNQVDDAGIIGDFQGTSSKQDINYGTRQDEGLGGAWDGGTIGRELWHYAFPDSLRGRVLSAKLVFTPLHWGIRPQGGQDMTIEAFRMLRSWKEGNGLPDGSPVSVTVDGASGKRPAFGQTWNAPLVGLDGVDAETQPVSRATLPDQSLQKMAFDITSAVQGWLENPETNRGLVFRNIHELDGLYLDYAGVASDDHPDATKRPYLILQVAPRSDDPSSKTVVLQPPSGVQTDAAVIGTFTGTGNHDGNNQGLRPQESLGGSWDMNTVGRLLWRLPLPDSFAGKTIVSAKAVFKVWQYCGRPLTGHDYKVEAYRMRRSWKEGSGSFPGEQNNASVDGATSLGPWNGMSWAKPLVGLDGSDADSIPASRSMLKYGDTTSMAFDFTALVQGWLANPTSNNGVIFRSMEEIDPSFPDYPGFWTSNAPDSTVRPKIVIQYR